MKKLILLVALLIASPSFAQDYKTEFISDTQKKMVSLEEEREMKTGEIIRAQNRIDEIDLELQKLNSLIVEAINN